MNHNLEKMIIIREMEIEAEGENVKIVWDGMIGPTLLEEKQKKKNKKK